MSELKIPGRLPFRYSGFTSRAFSAVPIMLLHVRKDGLTAESQYA
jgi:hypothetical protein